MNRIIIKTISYVSVFSFLILWLLDFDVSTALGIAATLSFGIEAAYDRWLWRINPLEKTPRISGTYDALFISNYKNQTNCQSVVKIKQTLSSISIFEQSIDGFSVALTASLVKPGTKGDPWNLYYTYETRPNPNDHDDAHLGAVHLFIKEKGRMEGTYFTNRIHQTKGSFVLVRRKKANVACPIAPPQTV